jgi:hypothetical protein
MRISYKQDTQRKKIAYKLLTKSVRKMNRDLGGGFVRADPWETGRDWQLRLLAVSVENRAESQEDELGQEADLTHQRQGRNLQRSVSTAGAAELDLNPPKTAGSHLICGILEPMYMDGALRSSALRVSPLKKMEVVFQPRTER